LESNSLSIVKYAYQEVAAARQNASGVVQLTNTNSLLSVQRVFQ